jgi:YidC/Oxa1 family membrane protein insertase
MNAHLISVLTDLLALTGLVMVVVLALLLPARGQALRPRSQRLPAPPAFAIAIRLAARGEFEAAAGKLEEVESSATYRNTAYAAEAAYFRARICRDHLHDPDRAMEIYNTLATTYAGYRYPHKAAAQRERTALWQAMDARNARSPLYKMFDFFVRLTGSRPYSYALALLLISVLVRLALWPFTMRQQRSLREMQTLQPQVKELQDRHAGDPAGLSAALAKLYRDHGVHPASGLLPVAIQALAFVTLFGAVSLFQYRFVHGTFFWIGSALAASHPALVAGSLAAPDLLLLTLYAISMAAIQRPAPSGDPKQARLQTASRWAMPAIIAGGIWIRHVSSAFVLFWLISNALTGITQTVAARREQRTAAG